MQGHDNADDGANMGACIGRPMEIVGLARHVCENMLLKGEFVRRDGALRMATVDIGERR